MTVSSEFPASSGHAEPEDPGPCHAAIPSTFGNIGRFKLVIESADEFVESDPMSRIPHSRATRSILAKGKPRHMIP